MGPGRAKAENVLIQEISDILHIFRLSEATAGYYRLLPATAGSTSMIKFFGSSTSRVTFYVFRRR